MDCIGHNFVDRYECTELFHLHFNCATLLPSGKPQFAEAADGHTSKTLITPISQMKKWSLSSINLSQSHRDKKPKLKAHLSDSRASRMQHETLPKH